MGMDAVRAVGAHLFANGKYYDAISADPVV
jgi:hypothetical protein